MPEQTIHIAGIGMITPLGDSTKMTAAAVRAGVSALDTSSIMNKRFEPMTMALVPEEALPPLNEKVAATPGLTSRQIRMLRMSQKPLCEALGTMVPKGQTVPLFLSVPEEIPECPIPINKDFINHLHTQCAEQFDLKKSRMFKNGRASGIEAVGEAFNLLSNKTEEFILVGGCDSYLDLYLLGTLDRDNRILANGVMDGFAPGEGAAFLLLASEKALQKHKMTSLARLYQPSCTYEAGHRYSDEPYKGDGLAEAVTGALVPLEEKKVQTVFASFNGENFFAKEWGVAFLRNHDNFEEKLRIEHPADCYGDPGAAAGVLLIGLAAMGMQKKYVKEPCMIFCSSEKEKRGAVCMKSSQESA
jgi:3-oxoacyl-[acyl-carrier-protein] synthase I